MVQYRSTGSDVLAAIDAALLAVAVGVVVATLAPFEVEAPSWPRLLRVAIAFRWSDLALNLALLSPVGFLLAMRRRTLGRPSQPLLHALLTGAVLSLSIESLQLFVPPRCPSVIDVVANAAGLAAGALLYARLASAAERALRAFLRRRLSLAGSALCAALLAALALAPLHAERGPRALAIGVLSALGAALFTFALAALCAGRVQRAAMARTGRIWV